MTSRGTFFISVQRSLSIRLSSSKLALKEDIARLLAGSGVDVEVLEEHLRLGNDVKELDYPLFEGLF